MSAVRRSVLALALTWASPSLAATTDCAALDAAFAHDRGVGVLAPRSLREPLVLHASSSGGGRSMTLSLPPTGGYVLEGGDLGSLRPFVHASNFNHPVLVVRAVSDGGPLAVLPFGPESVWWVRGGHTDGFVSWTGYLTGRHVSLLGSEDGRRVRAAPACDAAIVGAFDETAVYRVVEVRGRWMRVARVTDGGAGADVPLGWVAWHSLGRDHVDVLNDTIMEDFGAVRALSPGWHRPTVELAVSCSGDPRVVPFVSGSAWAGGPACVLPSSAWDHRREGATADVVVDLDRQRLAGSAAEAVTAEELLLRVRDAERVVVSVREELGELRESSWWHHEGWTPWRVVTDQAVPEGGVVRLPLSGLTPEGRFFEVRVEAGRRTETVFVRWPLTL